MRIAFLNTTAVLALAACGGGTTSSSVQAPGAEAAPATKALDAGAALLQDRPPIEAINAYLDGWSKDHPVTDAQITAGKP